jgi:uncharacterized membrane protein
MNRTQIEKAAMAAAKVMLCATGAAFIARLLGASERDAIAVLAGGLLCAVIVVVLQAIDRLR